jgi:hypothetical protein
MKRAKKDAFYVLFPTSSSVYTHDLPLGIGKIREINTVKKWSLFGPEFAMLNIVLAPT